MKKFEYLVIGTSLGLTVLFSTLFGIAGSLIAGTFFSWFLMSFLLIVICFLIVNSYFINRDQQVTELIELEALKEMTKISVRLSCAYCQQINSTPVFLNQKNTFKCESCNQVNGVSIQFLATALTTPIESVQLPIGDSEPIAEFKVSR